MFLQYYSKSSILVVHSCLQLESESSTLVIVGRTRKNTMKTEGGVQDLESLSLLQKKTSARIRMSKY